MTGDQMTRRTLRVAGDIDPQRPRAADLADFADVARSLQGGQDMQAVLDAMCGLAVDVIDGAEHAAVTVVRGGQFETIATTSDIPVLVDQLQYATGEGPCLDAIRDEHTFVSDDLATESRWPHFTAQVAPKTGVRSMMSFRLFLHEDTLGALNLYATRVAAFSDRDRALGTAFAAHAAVAYGAAQSQERIANLEAALRSNRRIGAAVGILMNSQKLTEQEAFNVLRGASQRTHRKLTAIADDVVSTGQIA